MARNARTSRRRFGGILDAFVTLDLELTAGGGLWTLRAATLREARLGLRIELERLARAATLCEAVRALVPEHHPADRTFAALGAALDALAAGDQSAAVSFYPLLLATAGIGPAFDVCAACGATPSVGWAVDARRGGLVCGRCAKGLSLWPASVAAVFAGAACPDAGAAAAVEDLALAWIEAQTGRAFSSRRVLASARRHG